MLGYICAVGRHTPPTPALLSLKNTPQYSNTLALTDRKPAGSPRFYKRTYPQSTRKTVRRHKICVLLRRFDSTYARYMSFKSALYPAQILCLLLLRPQTERISLFSRQTKKPGSTPIEDNAENKEIIPF